MADEPIKDVELEEKPTTGTQPPPVDTTAQDKGEDWWSEAQERGFKEQNAVWKSYRESEKKITEQAEQLKTAQKFEAEVAPILNAIWEDEKLMSAVRSKMTGEQPDEPINKKEDGDKEPVPQGDPEARGVLQSQILSAFEASKGIDKLDDESRKQVRAIIGQELVKWLPNRKEVPLNRFKDLLEDAFIIAEKKNEKIASLTKTSQSSDEGAFPSSASGGSANKDTVTLSADQKKVAARMGLSEEAYAEGLRKIQQ